MQDAGARTPVAEDHEILAEDAHATRRPVEIPRERDRLPESPEIFAARGAGTDRGELGIGRRSAATSVPVVCTTGRSLRGHGWLSMGPGCHRVKSPPGSGGLHLLRKNCGARKSPMVGAWLPREGDRVALSR